MKVAVAMSGGVDSAVAALLLKRQGHEVLGFFLHLNAPAEDAATAERRCCSLDDARDAQRTAETLGIDFYALPYRDRFAAIVEDFVAEYRAGRTPYPCVKCNQDLKFGALLDLSVAVGAEAVATGHYARLDQDSGRLRLKRAVDPDKDQSYVLFGIPRERLARAVFPIGGLTKPQVRALAAEAGLPVRDKPESQDLCFIPRGTVAEFLKRKAPDLQRPGPVLDPEGNRIGEHPGLAFFTVGQRKGLPASSGAPRYVQRLDAASNAVVAGTRAGLRSAGLEASKANWIAPVPAGPFQARVQIRYHHRATPATVTALPGGKVRILFETPQEAVTPGQAAVLYDGDEVLGGGWIDAAIASPASQSEPSAQTA